MVYMAYVDCKAKYLLTKRDYDALISEKERLFAQTQPKATRFDKEKVKNSNISNAFDDYLIAKEQKRLDERLEEIRSIVQDRGKLLEIAETELRQSKDIFDRIFRMRYLDGYSCARIAKAIHYSRSQVYRILDVMRENTRQNATF